jgi:hypothetical protein
MCTLMFCLDEKWEYVVLMVVKRHRKRSISALVKCIIITEFSFYFNCIHPLQFLVYDLTCFYPVHSCHYFMKQMFCIRLGFRFWSDLWLAELVSQQHTSLTILFCLKIENTVPLSQWMGFSLKVVIHLVTSVEQLY